MITIVDLELSNIRSIASKCEQLGEKVFIAKTHDDLINAQKIILPGVGSFDAAVFQLRKSGLFDLIISKVTNNTPFLGICLGFQLLTSRSEEGKEKGLSLINGETKRLIVSYPYKIPHMGWNQVFYEEEGSLFKGIMRGSRFYFVHSYHVSIPVSKYSIAHSNYQNDFICAIQHNNMFGVQFHPEKSHSAGKKLLQNFIDYKNA